MTRVNAKGFVQWEWMLRIIQKKGEWYRVYIVYGMCEELSGGCVVIEKVFLSFFKKSTNNIFKGKDRYVSSIKGSN